MSERQCFSPLHRHRFLVCRKTGQGSCHGSARILVVAHQPRYLWFRLDPITRGGGSQGHWLDGWLQDCEIEKRSRGEAALLYASQRGNAVINHRSPAGYPGVFLASGPLTDHLWDWLGRNLHVCCRRACLWIPIHGVCGCRRGMYPARARRLPLPKLPPLLRRYNPRFGTSRYLWTQVVQCRANG